MSSSVLKRYVFNLVLNCSKDWHSLKWFGSEFHSLGIAYWKALCPYPFVIAEYGVRRLIEDDRRFLAGW